MTAGEAPILLLLLYEVVFIAGKLEKFENQTERNSIKIANIQLEMERIRGTYINKAPSVPENPIKPKKTLIVALPFVLGFMASIMLAFLGEFVQKVRQQQKKSGRSLKEFRPKVERFELSN